MWKVILLIGLIALAFWILKKPVPKSNVGFQKEFKLNVQEDIIYQGEIYIPPHKNEENEAYDFFQGGKILTLMMTDQKRLILLNSDQEAYIFTLSFFPHFKQTSKKANLQLFARVASAQVLEVQLPENNFTFEWHVPKEAVSILLN